MTAIVPAADTQAANWRYTTTKPADDWAAATFNDSSWQEGKSGFGTRNTPGAVIGTVWNTREIWLRREIELPASKSSDPQAWLHHDEDAEVYINGVLALKLSGFVSGYDAFPLTTTGKSALKPGKNIIAIHCRQTGGGQYIDFGLVDVEIR